MLRKSHRHHHQSAQIDAPHILDQLRERTQSGELVWTAVSRCGYSYETVLDGVRLLVFAHGWPRSLHVLNEQGRDIPLGLDKPMRRQVNQLVKALYPFIQASMREAYEALRCDQEMANYTVTSKLPVVPAAPSSF